MPVLRLPVSPAARLPASFVLALALHGLALVALPALREFGGALAQRLTRAEPPAAAPPVAVVPIRLPTPNRFTLVTELGSIARETAGKTLPEQAPVIRISALRLSTSLVDAAREAQAAYERLHPPAVTETWVGELGLAEQPFISGPVLSEKIATETAASTAERRRPPSGPAAVPAAERREPPRAPAAPRPAPAPRPVEPAPRRAPEPPAATAAERTPTPAPTPVPVPIPEPAPAPATATEPPIRPQIYDAAETFHGAAPEPVAEAPPLPPPAAVAPMPLPPADLGTATDRFAGPSAAPDRGPGETVANRGVFFQRLTNHLFQINQIVLAEAIRATPRVTVEVGFTIDREGRVLAAGVVRSTGDARLDQKAVAVIQRASPVPRMPADMPQNRLELSFPVQVYR